MLTIREDLILKHQSVMFFEKNVLFQEELWCRILETYKPNHVVTVMSAKTFMKSL